MVIRALAIASFAGLLIAGVQHFVAARPVDWPFVALMIVGIALALMADKVRFHRRMAWIFNQCAKRRMTVDELIELARRDAEVREGLGLWARKNNREFLDLLRREGLYP